MSIVFLTIYGSIWLGSIVKDYSNLKSTEKQVRWWYAVLMTVALALYLPAWYHWSPDMPTHWIIRWVVPVVKSVLGP